MSLNYNYTGKSDTSEWTKEDWQTYNEMIWQSLAIDMGKLTQKNIFEWVRRCNIYPMYLEVKKCKCGEEYRIPRTYTVDEITKFIGLETNVQTLTANMWARKRFGNKSAQLAHQRMAYQEGGVK